MYLNKLDGADGFMINRENLQMLFKSKKKKCII